MSIFIFPKLFFWLCFYCVVVNFKTNIFVRLFHYFTCQLLMVPRLVMERLPNQSVIKYSSPLWFGPVGNFKNFSQVWLQCNGQVRVSTRLEIVGYGWTSWLCRVPTPTLATAPFQTTKRSFKLEVSICRELHFTY